MIRLQHCPAAALPLRAGRTMVGLVPAKMAPAVKVTAIMLLAGLALVIMGLAQPALADETQLQLKPGANEELVRASCLPCHSVDYIPMNSPFLTRQAWEATVNKMINVLGAPIAKDDVGKIVDYLAQNYGKSG